MNNLFILFGANGDLAQRKLLPAFYHLAYEKKLSPNFAIVAIGRRNDSSEDYHSIIYNAIINYAHYPLKEDVWQFLKARIYYKMMDFTDALQYCGLNDDLIKLEMQYQTNHKRIYYLAVSPDFFGIIGKNLQAACIQPYKTILPRVVIEKPFGNDLSSAIALNKEVTSCFNEDNTYRIDHYLGKEMLQNIMVIRFANAFFEPIWNNEHIAQIQISALETLGVESRGTYYEKSGAIRDMVQSHLLQLISLIAMEQPKSLSPSDVRDAKVKVLQSLRLADDNHALIRGQYDQYRQEKNVASNSNVETYVALKLFIDDPRWTGVPIYVRTGKRLAEKKIEIIIEFKNKPNNLYQNNTTYPNYLVIKIQPEEGIFLQFNAKNPRSTQEIVPVKMDFCQNCQLGINSPEAYERLLQDVMRGDQTLFARWDEIESSWIFIDQILKRWDHTVPAFPNYKSGSYGPDEANLILANPNQKWIVLGGSHENN